MFKVLRAVALVLALSATVEGFFAAPNRAARQGVVMMGGRKATPLGRTSTVEGKQAKVAQVTELLENSALIFAVPSQGLTVKEVSDLRNRLPENSKAVVVKNTLMRRACEGTDWAASGELTTKENMWFFVNEDEMRGSLDAYSDWVKEFKLDEKCPLKGGVFEGAAQDQKGVEAVGKLPTKLELYQKIAVSINMAGAQGIAVRLKKAAGGKLVKAINMAYADAEKNPNAPTE